MGFKETNRLLNSLGKKGSRLSAHLSFLFVPDAKRLEWVIYMQMKTIDDILDIRRNRYHLENLSKATSIVPFVGAGMSSEFYPMWHDFLCQFDLLSDERIYVNQYLDEGRFEDAASYICSISNRLFIDRVKDVFSPSHLRGRTFNSALKLIPQIADNMIITTNLDEVLETVWQQEGLKFDSIITPDCEDQFNDAIISNTQTLIKLHGSVQESTKYVLTKEQYDDCYGIDSNNNVNFEKSFPRNLGRAIQSKTFLFLGCSLKNDRILHILKQIAGWNEQVKHYALLALNEVEDMNTLRERELAKYGIIPIWFPDRNYEYISTLLGELYQIKKKQQRGLKDSPNTLPRDFSGLLGRDNEIAIATRTIFDNYGSRAVVISSFEGMPAIGKTTLAVRIAHLLSDKYPDAQLFIDCYGYTDGQKPLNPEQILDSLLFSFNISISRIPQKFEDKLSLWRQELSTQSVIIVFDNVRSETQIEKLLPSNSNSLFLITSRSKLLIPDSHSIEVGVLNADASVLLLNGGIPENDQVRYSLLTQLAEKYGYLPYALQIISHQILGRGNKYINRLIRSQNKFDALSVLSNAVYLSFDISYQNLCNLDQSLFQVLGLYPGTDFTPYSSAAMLGVDTESIYKSIDTLFQQSLIKEVGDDRYVMHDLMRDFSRQKYNVLHSEDCSPLIRLIEFYIESVEHCCKILDPHIYREKILSGYSLKIDDLPESQNDAFSWLTLEIENILACLDTAKEHKWDLLYFKLSYVLSPYIMKRLSGWRVIKIYEYVTSCDDLDCGMHAAALSSLANAYHQVGMFNEALVIYGQAEKSWLKLKNKQALADTLGSHAFSLERLGKYPDALKIIDDALQYERELNNLYGIASVLNSKGAIYWRMEKYPEAKIIFEEAIEIRNRIGDEFGASSSINNLAFTMLKLGDEPAARNGFSVSLLLSQKYKDHSGEAVTLNNLGYTELFVNRPSEAINHAIAAFNEAIHVDDEYQVARSYDVKGKAYMQLRDKSNAIINFENALVLFEKLSVPEAEEVKEILSKLY